jgi:DNA-binding NtrC family response regulator
MAAGRALAYQGGMEAMVMDPWDDRPSGRTRRVRVTQEDHAPRQLDLEVLGAAAPDVCILFTGAGSARDLARRVHNLGRGTRGRLRVVDCRWPEDLLEQQILHALRPGSSGTVFLEDVGRLSLAFQERLLETLDASPDPRGPRPPRARVMASTSEPLLQRALEGSFNERLFYRLSAIHVVIPMDLGEL